MRLLVGLPEGLIENVTAGTNAWLVGLDEAGHLLPTEEALVDANRPHRVRDIFLVDRPVGEGERAEIRTLFRSGKPDLVGATPFTRR